MATHHLSRAAFERLTAEHLDLAVLDDLCQLMVDGSLCALGGLTPLPVVSALTHFKDDFLRPRGVKIAAE